MDDVKDFVKKYWPYIVGAVVGLYIILKYSGGGSSGAASTGDNGYAAFLQAQTAAGAQNAALQLQAQTAADTNALNNKALDAQIRLNLEQLKVQDNKNYADAFNNFQATQSAMAGAIGSSTAQIIEALNAPSIMAMQAGAIENMAALEGAGNVAAASFQAQGNVVASSAQTAAMMASVLAGQTESIGQTGQKNTDWAGIINAGANAYSTYMTGGLMNNQNQSSLGGYNFGTSQSPFYNSGNKATGSVPIFGN